VKATNIIVNRREKPYPKTEPMRAPPAESVTKRLKQTTGPAGATGTSASEELGTESVESSCGGVISSESAVAAIAVCSGTDVS
jgi:hypothetical protein